MSDTYSLTERLAKQMDRLVEVPEHICARRHLLDWLACVVGARNSDVARCFDEVNDDAAAKSAFLGNVLEMDDIHRTARLHPGPVIWPTVLFGDPDSMDAMLSAAVRGYEAMIAIGATLDAKHYSHFHPTATAGVFGAAAAAAALLECDAREMASALGLAGSVSGGVWQTRNEPVMAKQWHIMHAMMTGGSAAYYARIGMTGPRFVLEGPQGLYAAICDAPKPLMLGPVWRIHEVSFKPWAACRHAQPAMDATRALMAQGATIDGPIEIATYADALAFCDRPDLTTEAEAKFSIQHAVAVMLDGRFGGPEDFTPAAIAALAPITARVTVVEAPEFTSRYPEHYGARASGGGMTVDLVDTLGDPERPLDEAGLIAKVHSLFKWGGLGWAEANRAIDLALHGDDPAAIRSAIEEWLA